MRAVAPRLGFSDVGLAKICRKLLIPRPWRGYWREKETGHIVRQPKLSPWPEGRGASPVVTIAREQRAEMVLPATDMPESVHSQLEYEARPENAIRLPAVLSAPCPLVRRARSMLRQGRTGQRGLLTPREYPCLDISVSRQGLDRALRIAEALVGALESRGFTVTTHIKAPHRTTVTVFGEDVPIRFEERIRQVEKPHRTGQLQGWVPFEQRFEFQSTDLLTLRILDLPWASRVRQSWSDGKKQRIENCLNRFVIGLVEAAEAIKAARREREGSAREQQEAERRRVVELERREREKDRREELGREIQGWRHAEEVRQYYAALLTAVQVSNGDLAPDERLSKWLRWIEAYAARLDPLRNFSQLPRDPEGWSAKPLDLDTW